MSAITEALARATSEVLEEAAYVFCCPTDEPPPFQHGLVQLRVPFHGPMQGEVVVTGPRAVLRDAAEHATWTPRRRETNEQLTALAEMIARTFVVSRWGADEPVRLETPLAKTIDPTTYARRRGRPASLVTDDGVRIDVEVSALAGTR